jgi:phosphatidylglycerophosphate synthase
LKHPCPSRRFNTWTLLHSAICLYAGLAIVALRHERTGRAVSAAVCFYSLPAFAALFSLQGKGSLRAPNLASLARLLGAAYALLSIAFPLPGRWALFLVVAAASASDFADGALARRIGPTPFGGKLDMELDAFNMYALSIAGLFLFQVGTRILALGLMRYCYVFALLILPPADRVPRWSRLAAKSICAFAVAALVIVTAPVVSKAAREALVTLAVGLLSLSFGIDIAVRLLGNEKQGAERTL